MSPQNNHVTESDIYRIFEGVAQKYPNMQLPLEIQTNIIAAAIGQHKDKLKGKVAMPRPSLSPGSTAPANGASPFMAASSELRRRFFAEALPDRDTIHYPSCEDAATCGPLSSKLVPSITPRRNRVSDLMTLNRRISSEITEVLYEERFFVIHVHEGLQSGGIEFLDAGRQPLQYKDSIEDARFHKFGKDDEFGFHRLKKIIVQIYPTTENRTGHTALNTYFMNLALCRLLQRSGEKQHRITSIKIEFPEPKSKKSTTAIGRSAIQRSEQYWWDADKQQPRATSITNVSNIELVLRPFGNLTSCHSVNIELPQNVRNHQATVDFVSNLEASMTNRHGTLLANDKLEMNIETARDALEEFVNYTVHGKGHHHVPKLTEAEMNEDLGDFDSAIDLTDEDGSSNSKYSLSTHKLDQGSDWKGKPGRSRDDWVGEQRLTLESYKSIPEEEDRLIAAAIDASLAEMSGGQYPTKPMQVQPSDMKPAKSHAKMAMNGWHTQSVSSSIDMTSDKSPFKGPGRTLSSSEGFARAQFSEPDVMYVTRRSWSQARNLQYPSLFGSVQNPVSQSNMASASDGTPSASNGMSSDGNNGIPASYGFSARYAQEENSTKPSESYYRNTSKLNPLANDFTPAAGGPNARTTPSPQAANPALVRPLGLTRIETIDLTGDSDNEDNSDSGDDTRRSPLSAFLPMQTYLRLKGHGATDKAGSDTKKATGGEDQQ